MGIGASEISTPNHRHKDQLSHEQQTPEHGRTPSEDTYFCGVGPLMIWHRTCSISQWDGEGWGSASVLAHTSPCVHMRAHLFHVMIPPLRLPPWECIATVRKCMQIHALVVHSAVQYKQWVYTWSICQSNLQILQRKLQHRPGSDTNTPNTQQHTDRTHSATGARGSLQPGFNQVIPLHQRAPWCDVSLTSLISMRGRLLHTHTHTHTHIPLRLQAHFVTHCHRG
mmetsp:Transcript_80140/g.133899  ORF Transcript_80140/g.133899 Transcript_80140/m.133899 type:complete len:225 (-) Transcript_80140:70-744(-)